MTEIEHRHLRSALEFAVLIAAEGQKRRPPLPYPRELKAYFGAARVPASALGRIRRVIEADSDFRGAISAGALPELVDDVGRLWLAQGSGWETEAAALVADQHDLDASKDAQRELKRSEKRRAAAEQAAARAGAELVQQRVELDGLRSELDLVRSELVKADDEATEMRIELIDTRNELRHARDREAAAIARAQADVAAAPLARPTDLASQVAAASVSGASTAKDVGEVADHAAEPIDRAELDEIRRTADELAARLAHLLADGSGVDRSGAMFDAVADVRSSKRGAGVQRVPVALPGGTIATSAAAADHLVRSGAVILIDGYNVAMLAWPERRLEQQREALIARVENLARRHGADITIVFDGSSVVGAHTGERRTIRVMFSPEGVTADDVIRDEVARRDPNVAVAVVTNDREIAGDVRAAGANVIPSNALLAVL